MRAFNYKFIGNVKAKVNGHFMAKIPVNSHVKTEIDVYAHVKPKVTANAKLKVNAHVIRHVKVQIIVADNYGSRFTVIFQIMVEVKVNGQAKVGFTLPG